MPWNYNTTVRSDRLQVVVDAVGSSGKLQIGTTGMASVLSTVTLPSPCGTISSGILTFSGTPIVDLSAAHSGSAVAAQLTNSAGTVIASGMTVGVSTSGADFIINLQNIVAGSMVVFLSGVLTGN